MSEDELYRPLNSQGMNVFDIMEFHGMTGPVKIVKDVLAAKNAEIARLQERNGHIDDGRVKLLEAHARTLQDTVNSLQADLEQARIFIKSFGIKLSFAGIYFAHRAKEAHLNWRHMAPWLDHLDYIQEYPDF